MLMTVIKGCNVLEVLYLILSAYARKWTTTVYGACLCGKGWRNQQPPFYFSTPLLFPFIILTLKWVTCLCLVTWKATDDSKL